MARLSFTLLSAILLHLHLASAIPWLLTEYHESVVSKTTQNLAGGLFSNTVTNNLVVSPTAAVTPLFTTTATDAFDLEELDLTLVEIFLPTDAPVAPQATPTDQTCTPDFYTACPAVSTPPPTNYWAPMTVVAAECQPIISYVTLVSVTPPPQILLANALSITSTVSYVTTSFSDAYVSTAATTWTEIDLYLAPGQVAPELRAQESEMLGRCQDPRGCYNGVGFGCTATGVDGFTESHGPPKETGAAASGKETGTGKPNAGVRSTGKGFRWWVICGISGVGVLVGAISVL